MTIRAVIKEFWGWILLAAVMVSAFIGFASLIESLKGALRV